MIVLVETKSSGGINISGLLGIVFITLKLIGVIDWSWLWVLSPFWIPILLVIIILAIVGLVALIEVLREKYKKRE